MLPDAPLGYLTAYEFDKPRLDRAVELWPRMLDRPLHREAVRLFAHCHDSHLGDTLANIRKLLDTRDLLGRPLGDVPRPAIAYAAKARDAGRLVRVAAGEIN